MKNLFLWLALLGSWTGLLSGCQGTDPVTGMTTVEGQVVESQSKRPVAGATVQVYHAARGGGYVPVGAGYPADATGHFAFSFEATEQYGYLVLASAPPGYFTDFGAAPSLTAGRGNAGLLIPVLAPAWVKLRLVDEPPKSRVVIHVQGYTGSGETLTYPRDTVLTRPILANFKLSIAWFINDQGKESQSYQEIQATSLDTVTVRIPF